MVVSSWCPEGVRVLIARAHHDPDNGWSIARAIAFEILRWNFLRLAEMNPHSGHEPGDPVNLADKIDGPR
jgi:hypothetical protein